jgi:endoglucanase
MLTTTKKTILHLAVIMATFGAAGCGGGSDDAPAPAPETKAPVTTTPPVATTPAPTPTACAYTTTAGAAAAADTTTYSAAASEKANPNVITSATVGASVGGALQVKKINCMPTLTGADGKPIQLRGMSTGGLQWHGNIVNDNAFQTLKKDWGANVVRLAMYVGEGGYATKPELFDQVTKGIDLAIKNDLYVIVDWHVLTPGDPNADTYKGALDFFTKISTKYKNDSHIIYELANEPNNNSSPGVTNDAAGWAKVKSYATPIIKMLRDSSNKNLVIVGTPSWSQRPDLAADNPIADDNVLYTAHFYTGTHKPSNVSTDRGNVMSNARYAMEHGVGVFATEWGVSEASGDKGPYFNEADQWIDFLNKHNISWANWQLDNSKETSAALVTTTSLDPGNDFMWATSELSESGKYVRARIKGVTAVQAATTVPVDPNAFSAVAADWNDGTLGGWEVLSDSKGTATLSNEGGAFKLAGMTNSSNVGATSFWDNLKIAGNKMTAKPNIYGATKMTADIIVDAPATVAIAAVPQSDPHGWGDVNPVAVVVNPSSFVKQANGKYLAVITITPADSSNFKAIVTDTTTAGHTLSNIIMYVGASGTDTVTIDNIVFSGTRPAAP